MNVAPDQPFRIASILPLHASPSGGWRAGKIILLSAGQAPTNELHGLERAIHANQRDHLALLSATPAAPKPTQRPCQFLNSTACKNPSRRIAPDSKNLTHHPMNATNTLKHRHDLQTARKEHNQDFVARQLGYTSIQELERLAREEAESNCPKPLSLARRAVAKVKDMLMSEESKLAQEEARVQEHDSLISQIPTLEAALHDNEQWFAGLDATQRQAQEAWVENALVFPESAQSIASRASAAQALLELPITKQLLPLAIARQKAELKKIRDQIASRS